VESLLGPVTFEVLRARLVRLVKLRINNGEFTERGFSRILGISQSQTHNVLKGARKLQMHLADRILMKLGLSAMDLLNDSEWDAALQLKLAEWDRQILGRKESSLEIGEFAVANALAPKKPAARNGTKIELEDRKTG